MAHVASITLGEHFASFVDQQVAAGRYDSASDTIRAALRLLEEHEMRMEALRNALVEGERSGPPEPFDLESFLSERRAGTAG